MEKCIAKDAERAIPAEPAAGGWSVGDDRAVELVDGLLVWLRPRLLALVSSFNVSPTGLFEFERAVWSLLIEFGREVMSRTLNAQEDFAPGKLQHDGQWYVRDWQRTANEHVATLFGAITLLRYRFRLAGRVVGEPGIFPLEMTLGLTCGLTPAAADMIGRRLAAAGGSQKRVLAEAREWHDLRVGESRLRDFAAILAREMEETREECQVARIIEALRTAFASPGSAAPVLSVGRDGITLREYRHSFFEVATAATVSVMDRCGKRLATVYLACPPELGQATMTSQLTSLLTAVLRDWDGPLPTLAYVADCGEQESSYYQNVLRRMKHPVTGKRLTWTRVVDFYHAAERVWAMATALYNKGDEAREWARRMLGLLKRDNNGIRKLLNSAAAIHRGRRLSASREADYRRARRYLATRTRWLRYASYRRRRIPLGSGVTESACKLIYTLRLKLSGQRWSKAGADTILKLRTQLLSQTWRPAFAAYLARLDLLPEGTYRRAAPQSAQIAA